MKIVGVDVGITHLGLAELDTGQDGTARQVLSLMLVDVMQYGRVDEGRPTELYDRLDDFACKHDALFARADVIAIERQPLVGLQCVQLFFLSRWRSKCALVSPNSLHKRFLPKGLDYDERKAAMERLAEATCTACGVDWQKSGARWPRRHDVADALAISLLHAETMAREQQAARSNAFGQYFFEEIAS